MHTLNQTREVLFNQRTRLNVIANLPVPFVDDFYIPLVNYANALYRRAKELLEVATPVAHYYTDVIVLCDLLEVQIEILEKYHYEFKECKTPAAISHSRLQARKAVEA